MGIDLIFAAYPPFPDAIGEYMASLAAALRQEGVAAREQSVAGRAPKTGGSDGTATRSARSFPLAEQFKLVTRNWKYSTGVVRPGWRYFGLSGL
jgi:hypothetical protein